MRAQDVAQLIAEQTPVDRFGHEGGCAFVIGAVDGFDVSRPVTMTIGRLRSSPLRMLRMTWAVHHGHVEVDDGEIELFRLSRRSPSLAVLGRLDLGGRRRQVDPREFALDRIVVHHENADVAAENQARSWSVVSSRSNSLAAD